LDLARFNMEIEYATATEESPTWGKSHAIGFTFREMAHPLLPPEFLSKVASMSRNWVQQLSFVLESLRPVFSQIFEVSCTKWLRRIV
jgi:hypothetical protein